VAVKNDGTAWAWGQNSDGQLGNTSYTDSNVPVQVSNLTGIVAVAAGYYHSMALRSDGTVWAWGGGGYGQLGNGGNANSNFPVQASISGVKAIAAGYFHSLAIKNDGTVWAWGYNAFGQLGNGTKSGSNVPVQVFGLTGITAIAGGYGHSIAIENVGRVWAWGTNDFGELGDGTYTPHLYPNEVSFPLGTNITAIASGSHHSLAIYSPVPIETAPGDTLAKAQTWSTKNTQNWPATNGATAYSLYRSQRACLPNLLNTNADAPLWHYGPETTWTINDDPSSLGQGDFYWYIVIGVNASGLGAPGCAYVGGLARARIFNAGACP
jgi:alpha-tubulin suppressor-like RCC1 family protein